MQVKKLKVTLVQVLRLCTGCTAHRGSRGIVLHFHDHGTKRGRGISVTPCPSLLREGPGTHCTGGWVSSRARLDTCGKSRLSQEFNPRSVQTVASRYSDYATRPTLNTGLLRKDRFVPYSVTGMATAFFLVSPHGSSIVKDFLSAMNKVCTRWA